MLLCQQPSAQVTPAKATSRHPSGRAALLVTLWVPECAACAPKAVCPLRKLLFSLVVELISGPCSRCSHLAPALFQLVLGMPVLMAPMPPACPVNGEPPGWQHALQKHSFSDCHKLVDFAHLIEITEMKKLLIRMTDGGPNDQTA